MVIISDESPESGWVVHINPDTTILGDEHYFNNVMTQLNINQNWSPPVKLIRYFNNFNQESLKRISEEGYTNPSFFQQKDKRFIAINDDLYHISTGGYGIIFKLDNYVIKFVFEYNRFSPLDTTAEYIIPIFLYNNLKGDERYLIVCAYAMGLNYRLTFLHALYKRVLHMLILLIQVLSGERLCVIHFCQKKFIRLFNERKNNIEFVRLLSRFYPVIVRSNVNIINHFEHLIHFFEHEKRTNCAYDRGNVIIFPLARCSADKVNNDESAMNLGFTSIIQYIKFLFLQISLLYIKVYELPSCNNFIHADLKPDNILLFNKSKPLVICINSNNKKYTFNESIVCKLNDFDFSQVSSFTNKKVKSSIKIDHNWYYDFHFFVHTLLKTYPEIEKDVELHTALEELIMCCTKTNCNKCRLQVSIIHPISFLEKFVSRNIFSEWINDD
ncbi:serine-threonine kinase [Cetacean poxvirus 1]|nr:serine-threonine kinase [Cetacean poxvirus 1]